MKKKVISIALIIALIAVIAAGSFAYFTDTKKVENTFTVGNVKIDLIESNLHRENAGVANGATSDSELWSKVDKLGTNNDSKYKAGDTFYTDDQIKADAKDYKCDNVKLAPGQSYHKMPYVVNTGDNAAWIRIRVMIPAALDTSILNSSMYTTTAMKSGEFTYAYDNSGTVERNGIKYNVYTFTRTATLAAGEMTYWNVWGTIHMDSDVTNEEITALIKSGDITADGGYNVLVEADAIQAEGFADAAAAWAAFDKQA